MDYEDQEGDEDLFTADTDPRSSTRLKSPQDEDDWFLVSLESAKLAKNTDLARDAVFTLQQKEKKSSHNNNNSDRDSRMGMLPLTASPVDALKSRLMDLNVRNQLTDTALRQHNQQQQAAAAAAAAATARQKLVAESSDLGQARSVAKSQKDQETFTLDQKIQIQQNTQESLANDILSLVRTIKQDAISLSNKLAVDADVIRNTALSLEKSTGVMGRVGSKLGEYHRSTAIGWWFYIMAVVFMVCAVAGAMIIVRLFPKW